MNKIERVIAEIEAYKPWLWEAKANARDGNPLSFCQMKKAINKAGLVYSKEFYNKVRKHTIAHFSVNSSNGAS